MVGHGAFYLWIEIYLLCPLKWTPHFSITQKCLTIKLHFCSSNSNNNNKYTNNNNNNYYK